MSEPVDSQVPETQAEAAPAPVNTEPINEPIVPAAPFATLLGIDFGSTKVVTSFISANSKLIPSIVRNDTSDLYTLNILAFKENERLVGYNAQGHSNIHPHTCIENINRVLGRSKEEVLNAPAHLIQEDGVTFFEVPYGGERRKFRPEQVAAMILNKVQHFCDHLATSTEEKQYRDCYFVVPCSFGQRQLQALKDAAKIAGFNVHGFCRGPAAIATTYGLKHPLKENETKHVVFVDMGATEFTISLCKFGQNEAEVLDVEHTTNAGQNIDKALFEMVKQFVAKKHPDLDISGQRQVRRIYAAVNKAKTVLSTISHTDIVFPLGDMDIKVPITKEQLKELSKTELDAIKHSVSEFKQYIESKQIKVDVVEVFGGSSRMNMIKELIESTFGLPLSHTLDSDLDLAVGAAAYGASVTTGFSLDFKVKDQIENFGQEASHFLSNEELDALIQQEQKMRETDAALIKNAKLRNNLETFCFEMINSINDEKFKACFPQIPKKREFEDKLNEALVWLESGALESQELEERHNQLNQVGRDLVPDFFTKLAQDAEEKAKKEAEAAAQAALQSNQTNTEKKPKTNPQKLEAAAEKKELGNKHFVDLDFPSAVKRYTQALELCISLYDESPEQKKEADNIKLACYLNIAQCLIKVKAYDKAIENCKSALAIEPDNTKGLYRRGNAYFLTKEFELARADLQKAEKLTPQDKNVKALLTKTEAQIARQKEIEKQMCSRMFG